MRVTRLSPDMNHFEFPVRVIARLWRSVPVAEESLPAHGQI